MERTILTISIPTYNRTGELKKTVDRIVPQLTEQVQLNIYDNCSDIPATEILQEYLHLPNVSVFRNVTNIGGDANIMRCYEQCTTDWGWVLGDDDLPHEDAVSLILAAIESYPEAVFINFNSNLCSPAEYRAEDLLAKGQSQFIRAAKSFPNLLFISTNVYKMSEIKGSLRNAYRFISSFGAQVTLVLDYLYDHDAQVLFSHHEIVHWNEPEGSYARPDSVINKSLPDLLTLVKEDSDRPVLYTKLMIHHPFPRLSLKRLIHAQAFAPRGSRDASTISYISDKLFLSWVKGNLKKRTLIKAGGLMILIALLNTPPVSTLLKPLMRRLIPDKEPEKRFREIRRFDIYRHLKEDTRL